MYLASQIFSMIGMCFGFAAFQCKKHSGIMFFKIVQEFLSAVHYFLLGEFVGGAMNIVGCIRNGSFSFLISKGKKTNIAIALFATVFVVVGLFTWQGPKSIFVISAKVISCIAYGCKNTTVVRVLSLVTNSFWFTYNIIVFSVAAFVCDGVLLLSVIIGIIRHDIIPLKKKSKVE